MVSRSGAFWLFGKTQQQGHVSLLQVEVKEIEEHALKQSVRYCWNMFSEHTFIVIVMDKLNPDKPIMLWHAMAINEFKIPTPY